MSVLRYLPLLSLLLAPITRAETSHDMPHAAHAAGALEALSPQVSLTLDGGYFHDNQSGAGSELIEEAAGILHGEHFDRHEHGAENGFNLGEVELALTATVDPWFDGRFAATFSSGADTEIEEAWLQTRMLPAGLAIRAGRFLSRIGYQNSLHPHERDFADQNLAYASLLGEHGLNDTGIQLTWQAPVPFWLLFGAESLQGDDQPRFGTLIEPVDADAVVVSGANLPDHRGGPRLTTLFAKLGPDPMANHSVQFGFSWAQARQFQQVIDEDATLPDDQLALNGQQQLLGVDMAYAFNAYDEEGAGDVKLIAEYLRLKKDMTVTGADAGIVLVAGDKVQGRQDGYTLQATFGVAPRWQVGARYDVSGVTNTLLEAGAAVHFRDSSRVTLMLAFRPSEQSRLRLQVSDAALHDESGVRTHLQQVMLTATVVMGAHNGHGH